MHTELNGNGASSQPTSSFSNHLTTSIRPAQSQETFKPNKANQLLQIVQQEARVFRDKEGQAFATVRTNSGCLLTVPLSSSSFRAWLSAKYFQLHRNVISSSSALAAVGDTIRGQLLDSPPQQVYIR
ncbi:MAG: hypothetical protein EOP04_15140 [Proteobacteria bacterium]|nr:MAG: hypothetical protein EOP04_15140 [Pseudomonadota bacterium]